MRTVKENEVIPSEYRTLQRRKTDRKVFREHVHEEENLSIAYLSITR